MKKIDMSKYKLEDVALYSELAGMVKDRVIETATSKSLSDDKKFELCMDLVLDFVHDNSITMETVYEALLLYFVDWFLETYDD